MSTLLNRSNSRRTASQAVAAPTCPKQAPIDPAPSDSPRPSAVLVARLHEIKRVTKSLCAYFDGQARLHIQNATSLAHLAAPSVLQTPFLQASLFLPSPPAAQSEGRQVGWQDIMLRVRDATAGEAEAEEGLAEAIKRDCVGPLKAMRVEIKTHIAKVEKEVGKLVDELVKKREGTVTQLTTLSTSLSHFASTPLTIAAADDPFIVRSKVEMEMRNLVTMENDALAVSVRIQEETRAFEEAVWGRIGAVWAAYEQGLAALNTTKSDNLKGTTESINALPVSAEWMHFESLNHLIPSTTPHRSLDAITYPSRDAAETVPFKEGNLERKKRFVKNWSTRFFVLSKAGYLHEYPNASTPLHEPTLSLFLPACQLGPLPPPLPISTSGKQEQVQWKIEGRRASSGSGSGLKGSLKLKPSEVGWVYRARGWEEAKHWWESLEAFTQTTLPTTVKTAEERQGPGPTAVQRIGIARKGEETDEEVEEGSSIEAEDGPPSFPRKLAESAEVKPKYTETPGVISGAARDVKARQPEHSSPTPALMSANPLSDSTSKTPIAAHFATPSSSSASPIVSGHENPAPSTTGSFKQEVTAHPQCSGTVETSQGVMRDESAVTTRKPTPGGEGVVDGVNGTEGKGSKKQRSSFLGMRFGSKKR